MPYLEVHCVKCEEVLGEAFPEVHRWLDEFCGELLYGTRHRHLRHHLKGIDEVRKKWGDRAAMAAEIHIRQDLESEGWPPDKSISADSGEFRKSGLW